MGWFDRLFKQAPATPQPQHQAPAQQAAPQTAQQTIPPERIGLNGEYDQSGLAKRVAKAFDAEPELADNERVWIAQTGGTVVIKGDVPNQHELNLMINIAQKVHGATGVDITQCKILDKKG